MDDFFKTNYDYVKSYADLARLQSALKKYDDFSLTECLPITIPYGKNAGRVTAVFRFSGGDNHHWAHRGFMVFG